MPAAKSTVESKLRRNSDGDLYCDLHIKTRRVTVNRYMGKAYVDVREFYEDKTSGLMKPGTKGLKLTPEQWMALCEQVPHITAALENLPPQPQSEAEKNMAEAKARVAKAKAAKAK